MRDAVIDALIGAARVALKERLRETDAVLEGLTDVLSGPARVAETEGVAERLTGVRLRDTVTEMLRDLVRVTEAELVMETD